MFLGSKFTYVPKSELDVSDEEISEGELEEGIANAAYKLETSHTAPAPSTHLDISPPSSPRSRFAPLSVFKKNKEEEAFIPTPPPIPPPKPKKLAKPLLQKQKKADTNVVAVRLNTLTDKVIVATGDPVFCKHCKAVFSHISALTPESEISPEDLTNSPTSDLPDLAWSEKYSPMDSTTTTSTTTTTSATTTSTQPPRVSFRDTVEIIQSSSSSSSTHPSGSVWKCEFCDTVNQVVIDQEEIPKESSVDYLLEPPTITIEQAKTDSAIVLFCIDISGSMCQTSEISGKFELKSNRLRELEKLNTERADQWLPGQKRNVTYITRLQAVQAAVDDQFEKLSKEAPNRRCGIVTFNNEVNVIGDGIQLPTVITGDKLYEYDQLVEDGQKLTIDHSIKETREVLAEKLYALEEGGSTALGPAIVLCVSIASAQPGSKVIVCTDGKSNIGLGSLDGLITDEDTLRMIAFYQQLASYASSKGVSISVMSIKGDDCRMEQLGALAEGTGGRVDHVDPSEITAKFGSLLAKPIIATHATVTVLLHRGLFVKDETSEVQTSGTHAVVRQLGNVTSESELTFEYGVKAGFVVDKPLPFQVQVQYTRLDGARLIRAISNQQEATTERSKAEEEANVSVLATFALQQTSKIAQDGDYSRARLNNYKNMKMLSRAAKTEEQKKVFHGWSSHTAIIDEELQHQQETEMVGGLNYSDEEIDEEVEERRAAKNSKKKALRKHQRRDSTSTIIHQFKSANASLFE